MSIHFSSSNRKLNSLALANNLKKTQVVGFDLPAGYTCPCASLCKSYANPQTGKIVDGKDMQFRCYAASIEAVYKNVRLAHWDNFNTLKVCESPEKMAAAIMEAMPKGIKIIRIHASGDFFSSDYFQAWVMVANQMPDVQFFGYSKVLPYVMAAKPDNFHLIYSFGGKLDQEALNSKVPTCYVVTSETEAAALGVKIICETSDYDDFEMIMQGESFALLVHGTQPKK